MNSSTEVKASSFVKVALSSASLMVPFRARIVRTAPSYWFLFGDGRLVAWGRPQEWAAATARYQVETDYQPNPSPSRPRTADHS